MTCYVCGLPDTYHGQGDGIGSCECPRCDCCRAAPNDCDCRQDWDDEHHEPDEPWDPLCNDPSCPTLLARLAAANPRAEMLKRVADDWYEGGAS